MANEAEQAAAAALIEDVMEADPVSEVLGEAPVFAGNILGDDEASYEDEPAAPEQPGVDLSQFQADTSGLDWLEDEPEQVEEDEVIMPIFDDEEVIQPSTESTEWEDDEEKTQLRREVAKLKKQSQFLEKQRSDTLQKKWRAEAERRFPFADAAEIQATSRRGMLRAAADQHNRTMKKLEPILKVVDQAKAEVLDETRQEARQEAARAWGKPAVNVGQPEPVGIRETPTAKLDRGRGIADLIKERLKKGEYGQI